MLAVSRSRTISSQNSTESSERNARPNERPDGQPALADGATEPVDADWHVKVARAKEARRAGHEARKGKPATFLAKGAFRR